MLDKDVEIYFENEAERQKLKQDNSWNGMHVRPMKLSTRDYMKFLRSLGENPEEGMSKEFEESCKEFAKHLDKNYRYWIDLKDVEKANQGPDINIEAEIRAIETE